MFQAIMVVTSSDTNFCKIFILFVGGGGGGWGDKEDVKLQL